MATASSLLSEDHFLCSICLDVFTDPVTIPCGHNFCKNCITDHFNVNVQRRCPMCKEFFDRRPEPRVNTFISEMAAQFRRSLQKKSSEEQHANTGEVLCDVCTGTKAKALKSCLVCLSSYCETHLELHQKVTVMTSHKLIDAVENPESRMCKRHVRPLELFCKTDQMCVCQFCAESSHKRHLIVPLLEEYQGKKAELGKTEAEVQQMIQERQQKIQELKESLALRQEDAARETAASLQVFTSLIKSAERSLAELIDTITEKHQTTEKQTECFIRELEEEISELKKRSSELEQLSRTKDHLQFLQSFPFMYPALPTEDWTGVRIGPSYEGTMRRALAQQEETLSKDMKKRSSELEQLSRTKDHLQLLQSFPSLNPAPPTKDWTGVRVGSSYEGTMRRALAQLEETLSKDMKKMCADVELKRVQRFAVDVTLDPETANLYLILSEDGKQVRRGDEKLNLPDNPKRLSSNAVLGKQSLSSGRFYYEVQVKGRTTWALGVARETIKRKNVLLSLCPMNGFWTVYLSIENQYKALADSPIPLTLKSRPQKVGVFVDYEEGLVSFYDVDAAALIYSFTGCKFTEKLHPYCNPCNNDAGKNSTPLIISSVNPSD